MSSLVDMVNGIHRTYYARLDADFEASMKCPYLRARTLQKLVNSHSMDVRSQPSLYQLAAETKADFIAAGKRLASSGGRSRKPDALQLEIESIVAERDRSSRTTSRDELLDVLRSRAGMGVINDIDDEDGIIVFDKAQLSEDEPGSGCASMGQAKLKGLKDRLTRAKKKLRSR